MRSCLVAALLLALAASTQAGIIFGRKPIPVDPKTRVPELINVLRTERDAARRSKAAEELRNYDPVAFPEIVPSLIRALHGDTHISVRIDAAVSLAKLRPVQQGIGEALEQALEKDPSMRVRLQARSLLLQYHWAGYRNPRKEVPPIAVAPVDPPRSVFSRFLPPIRTTAEPRKAPPAGPSMTTKEPPLAPDAPPPPAKGDGPILP